MSGTPRARGRHDLARTAENAASKVSDAVLHYAMKEIKSLPVPLRTDDLNIPLAERKTIASLQAGDCRWPFGDPVELDFHFCGRSKVDGVPYCEFHMRRAFQAARPRAIVHWPNAA